MHLTYASSVHLSPHPVTSLHSSLPPCQTSLRQHNSLFSLSTTVAAAVPSAWLYPHHPPTLLPTRLPKGRKARLWPSAWWARTAVCSGITPAEKGGIPSPGTFVRRGHCLLLTRQLFKGLPTPTGEVKGRNLTSDQQWCQCSLHLRSPPQFISSESRLVWFLKIPLFFFTFNKANFYKHVLGSIHNQIYTADARTVIRMSP